MKKLTFTLVKDKGLQKFYKSSEILTKGLNRLTGKTYVFNANIERERMKEEFKHLVKDEGFEVVCLSNANSHAEKLSFAGAQNGDDYFRLQGQIEGVHTMMIHGGNINDCWEDERYLRLVARHNGYSQNQVEIIK